MRYAWALGALLAHGRMGKSTLVSKTRYCGNLLLLRVELINYVSANHSKPLDVAVKGYRKGLTELRDEIRY